MKELEPLLKETLDQIKEFRNHYISNEQAVRTQLIEPILNALGWKTANPKFVQPNAPDEEGKIPDYTLLKNGKIILIVEAKNLAIDLQDNKIINQLANYCYKAGIDFGILTNGIKWLLFKTFEKNSKNRIVWQINLENDKIETVAQNLGSFSYINVDKLEPILTLDNGWKSLIASTDSIINLISQKLLATIKATDPSFTIALDDLNLFTERKITELFNLHDIEDTKIINNIYDNEKNEKSEKCEVEAQDSNFKRRCRKTKIREKISVTFPDKTVIKHSIVADTFIETIKRIGLEKILPLNIYRSGVATISETKDDRYNQHKIGKYWIMVNTSTKDKLAILNEINKRLNLKLIIETFVNENLPQ